MPFLKRSLLPVLLLITSLILTGCKRYRTHQGFIFGTVYNITYESANNYQPLIEATLNRIDQEFSMFNDSSTVARLNRGEKPVLSPMYTHVYQLAQSINRETNGAFDITVAPLVNAWGFGFKHEQMPTAAQVDSLLKIRSMLDYSAIAKGYGCDAVAEALTSQGVGNLMVEIGGEIVVKGMNPKGEEWRVGITQPTEDSLLLSGPVQAILNITNRGMATSGNYRNFYYRGGRKYAHTIDPRTGYPVQHELLSATVIADDCATADAFATAFMVLGLDSARMILDKRTDLEAYFIYTTHDGSLATWTSPGVSAKLRTP